MVPISRAHFGLIRVLVFFSIEVRQPQSGLFSYTAYHNISCRTSLREGQGGEDHFQGKILRVKPGKIGPSLAVRQTLAHFPSSKLRWADNTRILRNLRSRACRNAGVPKNTGLGECPTKGGFVKVVVLVARTLHLVPVFVPGRYTGAETTSFGNAPFCTRIPRQHLKCVEIGPFGPLLSNGRQRVGAF